MEKNKLKRFTDTLPIRDGKNGIPKNKNIHKSIKLVHNCFGDVVEKPSAKADKTIKRLQKYLEEYAKLKPGHNYVLGVFGKDTFNENIVNVSFLSSDNMDNVKKEFEKEVYKSSMSRCIIKRNVH